MPQFGDDLFLGPAVAGGAGMEGANQGPSFMPVGVGPLGRVYVFDIVPLTAATANLAALQTLGAAGNFVLAALAGVTTQIVNGITRFVFDVPRAVSFTSGGNISGVNFTVTGFDVYGQPMTVTRAGPNANTVTTLKAFKSVVSVTASAAVATNTSLGTSDVFGIPVRVPAVVYIQNVKWDVALAADAGTPVAADATSPATSATGDVRGTYLPSSASNGVRRLVMLVALTALAAGPNATRVGAFGVTQV